MKKKVIILLLIIISFFQCSKKYELPPELIKPAGPLLKIEQLKKRLNSINSYFRFSEGDTSVLLTVTMDETSGNIYKQFYAADEDGNAIQLRLLNSGGIYQGDRFRLLLGGLTLICSNNMVSIDSVSIENNIVKVSSGHIIQPKSISMEDLFTATSFRDVDNLQSQFVRLTDVEFAAESRGKSFANVIARTSAEHKLGPCFGKTIGIRTSGLANFANRPVPDKHGEINGILQQYNDFYTLVLRSYGEWNFQTSVCGKPDTSTADVYLYKDFEDKSLTSGEWLSIQSVGTTSWTCSNFAQSSYYARISNKSNEIYDNCTTWLISPEIDLRKAMRPHLSFVTANSSTLSPLNLMVTEDFTILGGVSAAQWQNIPFAFPKGSFSFSASGQLDFSAWRGKKIRIGFRYSGTSASGSIWNLDNIVLKES